MGILPMQGVCVAEMRQCQRKCLKQHPAHSQFITSSSRSLLLLISGEGQWQRTRICVLDCSQISCLEDALPEGVVVTGRGDYIFLQNFTETADHVVDLHGAYLDVDTRQICTSTRLGAFDVKILKKL